MQAAIFFIGSAGSGGEGKKSLPLYRIFRRRVQVCRQLAKPGKPATFGLFAGPWISLVRLSGIGILRLGLFGLPRQPRVVFIGQGVGANFLFTALRAGHANEIRSAQFEMMFFA